MVGYGGVPMSSPKVAAEKALKLVKVVHIVVKKAFKLCFVFNGFFI